MFSSPTIRIHPGTPLMPDAYANNGDRIMCYDTRGNGATGKLVGCLFMNILKFYGHFYRKRTFNKTYPTLLTTSCLGLSDSSSRPPRRTTVWKQLSNTRKSLYAEKWQLPNTSLLMNSLSSKYTLEKQAGKIQNGASINRTTAAQNLSVVCGIDIRFKYWVDFISHDNWSDSQQYYFQLCPRLTFQLNKRPSVADLGGQLYLGLSECNAY